MNRENGERTSCLNEMLIMWLPEYMEVPSRERVDEAFPYGMKPQEIRMDPEGDKIITFNLLKKPLKEKQVFAAICAIQRLVERVYPESIQESARSISGMGGQIGLFSFITGGSRSDSFHIMFIMPVDGRMMLGSYHFPAGYKKREKAVFLDIIKSIDINTDT